MSKNKVANRAKLELMPQSCVRRSNMKATYTDGTRRRVLARDGKCVVCGTKENLTMDHVYPRGKGGCSHAHNLQVLCQHHNGKKGDRIPEHLIGVYVEAQQQPKGPAQTISPKDPERVILIGAVADLHWHSLRGRTVL